MPTPRPWALAVLLLLAGCAGGRSARPDPPTTGGNGPAPTSLSAGAGASEERTPDDDRLTPARLAMLGLAGSSPSPLTPQLWADPVAVACRFVLADTTYAATEDPAAVAARRAAFATERLAEDLAASSSGAARLAELRRVDTRYAGELLTASQPPGSPDVAVVDVGVVVVVTRADRPPERQARSYRLTLARDAGRWLVARVEQS